MPSIELTNQQVVDLVKQLPPGPQLEALLALAGDAAQREERMQLAERQIRRIATERGLDWDNLSDEQREAFIDDLVHEDRKCRT